MSCRAGIIGAVLTITLGALTPLASAEITSIAGRVEAQITEFRSGVSGESDVASDSYPDLKTTLPLQVAAHLSGGDTAGWAGGTIAAQFANPLELDQPNPEEFAMNLTLDSISPNIRYTAQALSEETREVLFSAGELGPQLEDGAVVPLTGRLFLDGALAIFAADRAHDLTGASVLLRVTVIKSVEGQEDETVFSGAVELRGAAGGDATRHAQGGFPTGPLVLTDLSILPGEFPAFHVLIVPDIRIDYAYTATVGQPFTLRAAVELEAANVGDGSGVAAVLGTPVGTLNQVINLTRGAQVAGEFVEALENERANPSGSPAFAQSPAPTLPLLPACGPLGLESLVGVAALVGVGRMGVGRRRRRR